MIIFFHATYFLKMTVLFFHYNYDLSLLLWSCFLHLRHTCVWTAYLGFFKFNGLWWHNSDVESYLSESKLAVQERCYVLCKSSSIEDEKHFIFDYKFYENNRNSFFHSGNLGKNLDETVNLNIIIEKNQRQTAKYLNLIYSVRQTYLYKSK